MTTLRRIMQFLLLFLVLPVAKARGLITMLDDIIEYYGKSTMVATFLCDTKERVQFMRHFASKHHQINNLPMTYASLFHPVPPNHITYVVDLKCPNVSKLLIDANYAKLFSAPFKWIAYQNEERSLDDIISKYFSTLDILVDSDVTIPLETKAGTYSIVKIFKRNHKENVLIENMGNWTETAGLVTGFFEEVNSRRRMKLGGLTLNTCIVLTNNDSINHLKDKRDIHIDSIAKVSYVLVEHLSNIVNASLNYSVEETWGYKDANNNWTGMVGELTRKKADIGGTSLFMTSERISIIDYIAMITPTRSKFIFRQPKLSYVTNVYTLPFDREVWVCICFLVLVIALVLYLIIHLDWNRKEYYVVVNTSNTTEIHNSWSEVVFIIFGALCQQGSSSQPMSVSGRIAIIFSLLSLMFLYTSYAANIVALLQSSSHSIQTLKDILNSRLDVGVDDTVFNHFYFPNATEPIRKAIYEKKVAPPGRTPKFYAIEEGVKRIREGLFAFHVETGPGYKFISETFEEGEKCGLQEIQYLQVSDPWLAIQKNSSFKKMLKVGLHLLQENGIQAREVGLIYPKKPPCISRGSNFISVGMVDCYPPLVVLAGGLVLSTILLVSEKYVHHRLKWYKNIWFKQRKNVISQFPYVD